MSRVVNMTELSEVVGLSPNTLSAIFRKHDDAPIIQRGSNGVPYEIDLDAFSTWLQANRERVDQAEDERREQLSMWAKEFAGAEEGEAAGMKPAERRALAEAVRAEDYVRQKRGQLVDRAALEADLQMAIIELRTQLLQMPVQLAKRYDLSREARLELERMIADQLNGLADRLGTAGFYSDGNAAAA